MTDVLEVKDLVVFYGDLMILKNVSLTIKEKEIVGLFGPNGHGKTTLLKTVSGLVKPKSGKIFFREEEITKKSPNKIAEMGIVHVPQEAKLWTELTVEENLMLGAYISRAWKKRRENLEIVYNLFPPLKERRNNKCETLSGGERQMLAIGRGLMAMPKLLMLDEPSLGLAPLVRYSLLKKIGEIREEMKVTILLVEQNVAFASKLSDRLYLMENGKIILHGTRNEIISNEYVKKAYLGII